MIMMGPLVSLLAVIAMAGWAAEPDYIEYYDGQCHFRHNAWKPDVEGVCSSSNAVRGVRKPDCLATMEAAMRAVAPFLMYGLPGESLSGVKRFHMELWSKDAREAFEHWQDAKRCWKEGP